MADNDAQVCSSFPRNKPRHHYLPSDEARRILSNHKRC
jgi:hypothetical protein